MCVWDRERQSTGDNNKKKVQCDKWTTSCCYYASCFDLIHYSFYTLQTGNTKYIVWKIIIVTFSNLLQPLTWQNSYFKGPVFPSYKHILLSQETLNDNYLNYLIHNDVIQFYLFYFFHLVTWYFSPLLVCIIMFAVLWLTLCKGQRGSK